MDRGTAAPGGSTGEVRLAYQGGETGEVRRVPKAAQVVQPLSDIVHQQGGSQRLIYTALHEAFFTYVKVAFFRGVSLAPLPPGESKQKDVRYLDIRENDGIDEAQVADWVRQASRLPGQRM